MIDLTRASVARSVDEYVGEMLAATRTATQARIVAFIAGTKAVRFDGRMIWEEIRQPVDASHVRVGRTSDFNAPWPDRPADRYALVPVSLPGGGRLGMLYVLGGSWTTAGLEQQAASIAALAQVIADYERASERALRDDLTGLPNEAALLAEVQDWLRGGARFAMVYMDLNDFKAINDSKGHDAGDRALQSAATAFAVAKRQADFVARLHGDEFVALLRTPQADPFLHRSREILAREGLTLSAGTATLPLEANTFEAAMKLADERMYVEKRARKTQMAQQTI